MYNSIHYSKTLNHCGVVWSSELNYSSFYLKFTISKRYNNLLQDFSHWTREQEHTLLLIKSLQSKGLGYRKISQYLNTNQIETKRKTEWTNTKVFSVLKRYRQREKRLKFQEKEYEMKWIGKMKVVFE